MSRTIGALRACRSTLLRASQRTGLLSRVAGSAWRQQRLLILGYHGVACEDEEVWDPLLFVSRRLLEQRLDLLSSGGYSVLPLGEALSRLAAGTLPPRSVAITFDDGMYNFYPQAFPLLRARGYPVTVFLTTYYCEVNKPIFNLALSYIFWKATVRRWALPPEVGAGTFDLDEDRWAPWRALIRYADWQGLSAHEKDVLAGRVAESLGVDYEALKRKRLVQLMNPDEVRDLAGRGVDFQLHTHRHRAPRDQALFDRELNDNRVRLERLTGVRPVHFCYPNGDYDPVFTEAFARHGIQSAVTCDPGLARPSTSAHLLPRFIDTSRVPPPVFESWASGVGSWVSRARSYAPGH
jgi:peptidoglycan/xylan/chitin deacetylase (PgdA/CDA1 family)